MATTETKNTPTVGPERKALCEFSTEEIVSELSQRAGVRRSRAACRAYLSVAEEGPVDVFVVKPERDGEAAAK